MEELYRLKDEKKGNNPANKAAASSLAINRITKERSSTAVGSSLKVYDDMK